MVVGVVAHALAQLSQGLHFGAQGIVVLKAVFDLALREQVQFAVDERVQLLGFKFHGFKTASIDGGTARRVGRSLGASA